jgi:hypothetical protein
MRARGRFPNWSSVEALGKFLILSCLWPPSSDGTWCTNPKLDQHVRVRPCVCTLPGRVLSQLNMHIHGYQTINWYLYLYLYSFNQSVDQIGELFSNGASGKQNGKRRMNKQMAQWHISLYLQSMLRGIKAKHMAGQGAIDRERFNSIMPSTCWKCQT